MHISQSKLIDIHMNTQHISLVYSASVRPIWVNLNDPTVLPHHRGWFVYGELARAMAFFSVSELL